jgi:fucose 4-O-acetylase-like acetyltransferase
MKKRLRYVDALAGIMITWMVLGHCSYLSHFNVPFYSLLCFYMPWFYYKSGMFYNQEKQTDLIRKDIGKFLKPFIIFSFIGWFVWSVCGMIDGTQTPLNCVLSVFHNFIKRGSISGNGPLWFLLSLFLVREFANVIIHKNLPIPIFIVICFLFGFGLYYWGWYNYSWWMGMFLAGCFFFYRAIG